MKAPPEFGKRGRKKIAKFTEPNSTAMDRLFKFGRRWWPGRLLSNAGQGTKLAKPRSLPQ